MIDKFNRNINYARISLTNMCNLKCAYCNNGDEVNTNISIEFYKNLIDALVYSGVDKIRFTGGEPLLNKNIIELLEYTSSKKEINDISITTNGVLFGKYADDLIQSGLTRINVSLDSINKDIYSKITGYNELGNVFKNIKIAKEKGIIVKINAVLLKGITDNEVDEFLELGHKNDIEIRFIELMPMGDNIEFYDKYYLSSDDVIKSLDCILVASEQHSVAKMYRYKNKYNFGIISAVSNHFCSECNRIRITSSGTLRLCLHSDDEIDLLPYKHDKEKLQKIFVENITHKPEKHKINELKFVNKNMINIGG